MLRKKVWSFCTPKRSETSSTARQFTEPSSLQRIASLRGRSHNWGFKLHIKMSPGRWHGKWLLLNTCVSKWGPNHSFGFMRLCLGEVHIRSPGGCSSGGDGGRHRRTLCGRECSPSCPYCISKKQWLYNDSGIFFHHEQGRYESSMRARWMILNHNNIIIWIMTHMMNASYDHQWFIMPRCKNTGNVGVVGHVLTIRLRVCMSSIM